MMAAKHTCRHAPLLALLLSAALAAVSTSCPGWQGSCSFRRAATGRLPSMDADFTLHDVSNKGDCARLCLDLLGARCQALCHHQVRQECRVYVNSSATDQMVDAPGHVVFTSSCGLESPVTAALTSTVCLGLNVTGPPSSGVYTFDLQDGGPPFTAFCDMTTDGGGWIVFQRRQDGSVDFNLNWTDYQQGFGDLEGEHWLGNDLLHRLTASGLTELWVDLKDWDDNTSFAHYTHFSVDAAASNYTLHVSGYDGTAGDGLTRVDGMQFSTKDRDNDGASRSCALEREGAWWFKRCGYAYLNSMYGGPGESGTNMIVWHDWRGYNSLPFTEMKLR